MEFSHTPVLLREAVDALGIDPAGVYYDGTAGGGGHSFAIASGLTTGRLVASDRDPDAVAAATKRLEGLPATVIRGDFCDAPEILAGAGVDRVDGALLDLGVSSYQLDEPERGFSYKADAPLDMRMSREGFSAADLVNTYPEEQIARILREYGEEANARPIARAIARRRAVKPITTTGELAGIIAESVPAAARRAGHPARRSFQAIRIAVNGEIDRLPAALYGIFGVLKTGGRLAVITFHSVEDRAVKRVFADLCRGCICPPDFPVCRCGRIPAAKNIFRGPVTPGGEELAANPRARSAKLRAIEKTGERAYEQSKVL